MQTVSVHTPLSQSVPMAHVWSTAHGGHEPPQSTCVSEPLLTPSVHVGGWQLPRLHTVLTQSVTVLHAAPTSHGGHSSPPQSRSDSLPFCSPSVELGA